MLNKETIKQIALANGFKLKEQANGEMDLNPYVYDTINKAIAFYESQKNGGWISVDDELPESNGNFYLVYTEAGRTCECRYYCDEWITTYCNNEKATHWQPLPQPPQE